MSWRTHLTLEHVTPSAQASVSKIYVIEETNEMKLQLLAKHMLHKICTQNTEVKLKKTPSSRFCSIMLLK